MYIFSGFSSSFESRLHIWSAVPKFMNGATFFFGGNFTNSQYMLKMYSDYTDFHSCYVRWFATTGLIGTVVYALLFIYTFYLIIKVIKKNPLQGILVLIFLLSAMIYSLPETAILFISTSLYTFVINIITIVYLKFLLKEYF